MYVERLVSAHNLIKSDMRVSTSRETLNDYLIVRESVGALSTLETRRSIARR